MAEPSMVFKKLPGRGGSLFSSTLWEGTDHLLLVKSWPSGESYRRFYFSDIQAIIIRRTPRRLLINLLVLLLAMVTVGPVVYLGEMKGAGLGWVIISGSLWLGCLLINTLLGPTCETHIQTAIQTEEIPSINRLRNAMRVLGLIQPQILAAQPSPDSP